MNDNLDQDGWIVREALASLAAADEDRGLRALIRIEAALREQVGAQAEDATEYVLASVNADLRRQVAQLQALGTLELDGVQSELAQAKGVIADLRARLDQYERGRCCVDEPPDGGGMYVVFSADYGWMLADYVAKDGSWSPGLIAKGDVWYPLPGGRDDG